MNSVCNRLHFLKISGVIQRFNRALKMIRGCQIVCPNNTHDPISLPDGVPVAIGRTPLTRIIDPRCSRNQVEITAHWDTEKVTVKQLGTNSSGLDGIELEQNRICCVQTGATIYVLAGQYPQKVEFIKETPLVEGRKKQVHDKKSATKDGKHKQTAGETEKEKHGKMEEASKRKRSVKDDDNLGPSTKKSKTSSKCLSANDFNDSEEEDIAKIEEKLKMMKEKAKLSKANQKVDTNDKPNKKSSPPTESGASNSKGGKSFNFESSPNGSDNSKSGKTEGSIASESSWENVENKLYVYTCKGQRAKQKIAAFDIDGTIITTQSGKVFPKDYGDWRLLYAEIPGKLKKLHEQGYKIVLITNQKGVTTGKSTIEELQIKFTNVLKKMGVIAQILVSTGQGIYRKPCKGMWQHLNYKGNDGITISREESFYVGDAAGRPEKWQPGKKKDFSCSDRLFAINCGLKFYTPEEYFLNSPAAKFNMPEFDPRKNVTLNLTEPADADIASVTQEVIVLVGCPGSGKSNFAKTHLVPKGYTYINRDSLGTWQKCVTMCKNSLKEGKKVVIDNTNKDKTERARYTDCARKAGVKFRCFVFLTTLGQCQHNERFREMIDPSHKPITDMIMHTYRKNFEDPTKSEGYSEIVKVNFIPKFTNAKHERLYRQFLREK